MPTITRWIPSRSVYIKIRFVLLVCVVAFTVFSSLPALAEGCSLVIPNSWKEHFPFDLVYPVGSAYQSPSGCPTIDFWGEKQPVCAIPQFTAVIKNIVLANIAIKGLLQL
jgi:hypothetical protein